MAIDIRRIKAEDWRAFKTLRLAALELDGEQFGQSFEVAKGYTDDRWREDGRRAAESGDFFIVLAFDDDEPVGISGCIRVEDFGKIIAVWVAAGHRGRGIGRRLVEETMGCVGAARYKLTVVEGNAPAIRIYEGLGFRATGFSYVNVKGVTEIEMEATAGFPESDHVPA